MSPGLQPLGRPWAAQAEERLRRAWPLLVGPALQRHARILRLKGDVLVLGCSELALLPGLRAAAHGAWPELRDRIQRAVGFDLTRIEVIPCDPPLPVAQLPVAEDPLAQVLRWYRSGSQD